MATTTTAAARVKRHPIRGFLYGIPFGLGLAMIAIGQKWAALGTWPPFILFIVGILVSMAWGMFGPAKAPKGPEPGTTAHEPPPVDPAPETETGTEIEHDADPVAQSPAEDALDSEE